MFSNFPCYSLEKKHNHQAALSHKGLSFVVLVLYFCVATLSAGVTFHVKGNDETAKTAQRTNENNASVTTMRDPTVFRPPMKISSLDGNAETAGSRRTNDFTPQTDPTARHQGVSECLMATRPNAC